MQLRSSRRGAPASSSAWAQVLRSAGARVLVLPVTAGLGIVNTRLIIQHYGSRVFAQYGLLVAIVTLIPFADLGMSAAIMNATGAAEHPATDDHLRRVLVTSVRVLVCSMAVILLVAAAISLSGAWPSLLGDGLLPGAGPRAAALCLCFIGITLPVAFGPRVLTGLGKNHLTVALLGLQTPLVLLALLVLVRFDIGDGAYIPVIPYAVTFVITLGVSVLAARMIRPSIGQALRGVPRVRTVRGARVLDVAWPMLLQMIAVPIAMSSDRVVLSHVADSVDLVRYNLSAQLYLPVWQVVSAAGVALWPIFARARADQGAEAPAPTRLAVVFGLAAAAVCAGITVAAPFLIGLASDQQVTLPTSLLLAFSLLMIGQSAKYPLGMYMTDAAGLRFQAYAIMAMVPVNLGISIVLGVALGAIGPVIGSIIGVFGFQVAASWWYVRRAQARQATAMSEAAATTFAITEDAEAAT